MTKVHIKLTFTDDLLGTSSGNPDIHREFIASKVPDAAKKRSARALQSYAKV